MHTLPGRSVNTFQSEGVRRSSLTGMRYPRSSSLYLPHKEQNDESRSQLLPNEPYPGERRAQTLGRPQHHPHAAPSNNSRNMTNPLFDSATSLDQPWYRGYGQPVSLSPPRINLPDQALDSASGYGTVREMQTTIRVPSTRSPGRASAYSTSRRTDEHPVVPKRNWIGCTGLTCCEKEQSPYSTPDDLASSAGWTQPETSRPTQPWVVCLFTVSAIFDLFLMIVLAFVVFFLNCSSDGRVYMDRRIHAICTNLWTDWIPLHHRTFRCPALPPGLDETKFDTANPILRQYMSQIQPPMAPTTPGYGLHPGGYPGPIQSNQLLAQQTLRTLQGMHTLNGFEEPEAWDADLGLMPPPQVQQFRPELAYGLTTTRLYGPSDEHTKPGWGRTSRDSWLRLNPTAPYSDMDTSSIILGCTILPLVTIFVIEVAASCLACCGPFITNRQPKRAGQLRHVIGQLYRLAVTYTFGLLAVMLLALILQAAIGRLRPEFIKICRPSPNVCPRWAALLKAAGYGFDLNDPDAFSSDPQLMTFLQQESARRGFYLVPRTTTPSPNVRNAGYAEEGVFSDADCTEKNVLRMKYARTSFPSLSASVTMYATIFLAAYITHTLRYLRRTCFCIPLTLLLSSCLVNLLLGLGRVVYRKNWLEDVLAGWALGLIVAAYVVSIFFAVFFYIPCYEYWKSKSIARKVNHNKKGGDENDHPIYSGGLHKALKGQSIANLPLTPTVIDVGKTPAAYLQLYRTLKNKQNNKEVVMVSNAELQKQLHRIQHLLQTNQEYRQNEMKLMKYL